MRAKFAEAVWTQDEYYLSLMPTRCHCGSKDAQQSITMDADDQTESVDCQTRSACESAQSAFIQNYGYWRETQVDEVGNLGI